MTVTLVPDPSVASNRTATTYFIQGVDGGPVKIGRSVDIAARLRILQTGSAVVLRLVGASIESEHVMHCRFAGYRLHGEFFRPARAMLKFAPALVGPYATDADYEPTYIPVVGPPRPRPVPEVADPMPEQLRTVPEVAQVLRLSPRAVWRLVASGALPSLVVGEGARRVRQSDLDAFIADRPDPEDAA